MLKPIKWYKSLVTAKGRLEAGAFLVEGQRAINQIIAAQPEAILEILSVEEPPATYCSHPKRIFTGSQLKSICATRTPQEIAAVVKSPADIYSAKLPGGTGDKILLLDDIQDPGNIGTLIRTAAAFDFAGAILTDKCADPLSPKCVQSAAGTVLSLWLRRTPSYLELAERLKQDGYTLVATSLDGEDDRQILRQEKLLLALGNEASGLSAKLLEMSDYRLKIPIVRHKAESLNVAACGAICMYLSSCK
jgi:TrmH family RNA methyltransferase